MMQLWPPALSNPFRMPSMHLETCKYRGLAIHKPKIEVLYIYCQDPADTEVDEATFLVKESVHMVLGHDQ